VKVGRLLAITIAVAMGICLSCAERNNPAPQTADLQAQLIEIQKAQVGLNARMDEINHDLYVLQETVKENREAIGDLEGRTRRPQITIKSGSGSAPPPKKTTPAPAPAAPPRGGEFVAPPPEVVNREPAASPPKETGPATALFAGGLGNEFAPVVQLIKEGQYGLAIFEINELGPGGGGPDRLASVGLLRGECYFGLKDYPQAVKEFHKVINIENVEGEKASHALYKIGLCLERISDPAGARAFYDRAANEYPGTRAAELARERRAALE